MTMFGVTAGMAYVLDPVETARRDLVGLGPVLQRDVLDTLMGLPVGMPVAVGDLSARETALLRQAPRGTVEQKCGKVIRRVVRPTDALLAVIAARSWQDGMVKAGRFAPFCARMILLRNLPSDLDHVRMHASFYGIGVCAFDADALRVLVEPEQYIRHRHSAAQWWFSEELYRQARDRQVADHDATEPTSRHV